jgi:dihydrofolate reductase
MRKIVAGLFISLDGVVEAPEKWHFQYHNAESNQAVENDQSAADTLLLGRVTYAGFAEFWPASKIPMAGYMNGVAKVVVSTTLEKAEWNNSTLIQDNVRDELLALKAQPGKDILVAGSIRLIRWLLREGLLDKLSLLLHPVIVGHGERLFETEADKTPLRLSASQTFETGVVRLVYEVEGSAR